MTAESYYILSRLFFGMAFLFALAIVIISYKLGLVNRVIEIIKKNTAERQRQYSKLRKEKAHTKQTPEKSTDHNIGSEMTEAVGSDRKQEQENLIDLFNQMGNDDRHSVSGMLDINESSDMSYMDAQDDNPLANVTLSDLFDFGAKRDRSKEEGEQTQQRMNESEGEEETQYLHSSATPTFTVKRKVVMSFMDTTNDQSVN